MVEEVVRDVRERRYGYSAYAALGSAYRWVVRCAGSLRLLPAWAVLSQLGPASIVIGAVVGALFGAALRDTRRL
jgi:hypothetical protein